MNKNINIIKLEADTSGYEYGMYDTVKFYDSFSIREVLQDAEEILGFFGIEFSIEDAINKWMEVKGIQEEVMQVLYEDIQMYNDNYETIEEFKKDFTVVEYIDGNWEDYLPEIIDLREGLGEILSYVGLDFGTVGYSPWSFYIAKGMDYETVRDIYENWNFYKVSLIENDSVIDTYYNVYIPDTKELIETVENLFDVKEFYLVDNDEATYMDVPKVEEIVDTTYSYEVIK